MRPAVSSIILASFVVLLSLYFLIASRILPRDLLASEKFSVCGHRAIHTENVRPVNSLIKLLILTQMQRVINEAMKRGMKKALTSKSSKPIRKKMPPFNYGKDFKAINFRKNPEEYQVGKGEQGVLLVEPYKSEICQYWRFKTPEIAENSAKKIYSMFLDYKSKNDFVGMDMARKFLQMGYTRSRRYANHKSGRKWSDPKEKANDDEYNEHTIPNKIAKSKKERQSQELLPNDEDPVKAASARVFYGYYLQAREDEDYKKKKKEHQDRYG